MAMTKAELVETYMGTPLNKSIDTKRDRVITKGLCRDSLVLTPREFLTTLSSGALNAERFSEIIVIVRIFLNGWVSFCWKQRRDAMPGHFYRITFFCGGAKFPSPL